MASHPISSTGEDSDESGEMCAVGTMLFIHVEIKMMPTPNSLDWQAASSKMELRWLPPGGCGFLW